MVEAFFLDPAALADIDLAVLGQLTQHDDTLLDRCESEWLTGALEASLAAEGGSVALYHAERVERRREPRWHLLAAQRCHASHESVAQPVGATPRARARERRDVRPRRRVTQSSSGDAGEPGEPGGRDHGATAPFTRPVGLDHGTDEVVA